MEGKRQAGIVGLGFCALLDWRWEVSALEGGQRCGLPIFGRHRAVAQRWKAVPRRYGVGVTFQYFPVRKVSLEAHIRSRAMLHGRMLELLETHYQGWLTHVVFEPKPLRV